MNKLGKALVGGAIFLGGYLTGFYEMKYKMVSMMLKCYADKETKEKEEA